MAQGITGFGCLCKGAANYKRLRNTDQVYNSTVEKDRFIAKANTNWFVT